MDAVRHRLWRGLHVRGRRIVSVEIMTRRLCATILLICCSVFMNIVVAWMCAAWLPLRSRPSAVEFTSSYTHIAAPHAGAWAVARWKRVGAHRYWITWYPETDIAKMDVIYRDTTSRNLLAPWAKAIAIEKLSTSTVPNDIVIDCRGWPYPCLFSIAHMKSARIEFGIPLQRTKQIGFEWALERFALPLRPVWLAFTINTLVYLGVLICILWIAAALRVRRRLAHGLCPVCKYRLVSNGCSECGWHRSDHDHPRP